MSSKWQLKIDGKIHGPYTSAQLKKLVESGKVDRQTLVRPAPNTLWVIAGEYPGLFDTTPPEKRSTDSAGSRKDDKWFVARGQQQLGPFTFSQLQSSVQEGKLRATDLVWKEGSPNWVTAASISKLFPIKVTPPPLPDISTTLSTSPSEKGSAASQRPEMQFCSSCGSSISIRAAACPKCGFNPRSENNYCNSCGTSVKPQQVMCLKCGASLEKVAVSSGGGRSIMPRDKPHDPVLMALLSGCCFAGLGQIIIGQTIKGVVILTCGIFLAIITGGLGHIITAPLAGIDAYIIASKLKNGKSVGEWECF